MSSPISRRVAERLSRFAGCDSRAEELRAHLADSEADGHRVSIVDVGSIGLLVARTTGRRMLRDLPLWLAALPVAFLVFTPVLLAYETHFFAWDMIERPPEEASARFWKRAVDALLITSFVAGLIAGRRCIEHLRHGRVVLPGVLLLAVFVAVSQVDLFVERTPWWRDGGLRESHINELSMYSVALFAVFASIPLLFVDVDLFVARRVPGSAVSSVGSTREIDHMAIGAIVLPMIHLWVPLIWILPFLTLVWMAGAFGRSLKIVTTAVAVIPFVGALLWNAFVAENGIDDGTVFLLAVAAMFFVVWCRLAFVALRPGPGAITRGHKSYTV